MNHFLREHGFTPQFPQVSPLQLYYIEIDPYAHDLAQTVVWIGYIQWLRANGYGYPAEPILKPMGANFLCADSLFTDWPEVDFIVGNPPFLGGKKLRTGDGKSAGSGLGDEYVEKLFAAYRDRLTPEADLCCYWFEKAREQIEHGKCQRAGLLATQGIRGGANREVLKRIKETCDIFFAESDRPWIINGANVHVSMVAFDNGAEKSRVLDGKVVKEISPQLDAESKTHTATIIKANTGVSFMGITPAGPFDISSQIALDWLLDPNASGKPNSDILRPYFNGNDLTKRAREAWTVDFGVDMPLEIAASYEKPFGYLEKEVKPIRGENRREAYAKKWWIYAESRPAMRGSFSSHSRFLATCMVAKHRMFVGHRFIASQCCDCLRTFR